MHKGIIMAIVGKEKVMSDNSEAIKILVDDLNVIGNALYTIVVSKCYPNRGPYHEANLEWLSDVWSDVGGKLKNVKLLKQYEDSFSYQFINAFVNNDLYNRILWYRLWVKGVMFESWKKYIETGMTEEGFDILIKDSPLSELEFNTLKLDVLEEESMILNDGDEYVDRGIENMSDEELGGTLNVLNEDKNKEDKMSEMEKEFEETMDEGVKQSQQEKEEKENEFDKEEKENAFDDDKKSNDETPPDTESSNTLLYGLGAVALGAAAYFGYKCIFADGCSDDDIVLFD